MRENEKERKEDMVLEHEKFRIFLISQPVDPRSTRLVMESFVQKIFFYLLRGGRSKGGLEVGGPRTFSSICIYLFFVQTFFLTSTLRSYISFDERNKTRMKSETSKIYYLKKADSESHGFLCGRGEGGVVRRAGMSDRWHGYLK